ncbi:MAG: hypothetical protein JNK90_03005 [Planctomycetaceae bacterium]|nr:hypothetical protein [Planctomycetaceae bacterium]
MLYSTIENENSIDFYRQTFRALMLGLKHRLPTEAVKQEFTEAVLEHSTQLAFDQQNNSMPFHRTVFIAADSVSISDQ